MSTCFILQRHCSKNLLKLICILSSIIDGFRDWDLISLFDFLLSFLTCKEWVWSGPGKEKLSVAASEPVRLVLESDGTQVEDGEYWRTLPPNTVLLLLRPGERWYPTGVDVIKAGMLHVYLYL